MAESSQTSWRRMPWALAFILGVALTLRLAGIGWGLPNADHYFSYHPDEIFLLLPSFGFAQGDLNPHFFNYGTLYLYLVGLPAVALGLVPDPASFPAGLRSLYLEGRIITALLGSVTVLLLYLALRRESPWLARISAAFLAICPLHVVTSHYATVDVPATLFLTLAFLFTLRGADRADARAALPVGLAVGLAAATKYNAGLFLLPALVAPLFAGQKLKLGWWLALPAGALVGFLIGNPYVSSDEFLKGFLFELRHAQAGGTLAFVDTGPGWAYHLTRGLPVALGYPLLAATVAGIVAAIARRSPAARLSLLWIIFYLSVIGFGKERFIRYLVPLTPFLCVLAAWGIMWLIQRARRPRLQAAAALLGCILMLLTALYAGGRVLPLIGLDARDFAWLQARSDVLGARPEARIGLVHSPWYYHPPVSPYNAGGFSRQMFDAWNAEQRDRVVVTGWDGANLAAARPSLFFLSDLESADPLRLRDPAARGFLSELERRYSERRTFGGAPIPFSWLAPGRSRQPPDWLYDSPRITVYYGWRE